MYITDRRLLGHAHLSDVGWGYALGQSPLLADAIRILADLNRQQQAGIDPNQREREQIRRETGVKLEPNPYLGLTDRHLEAVLNASESSVGAIRQTPEVLLAL
jgi:hypothetical protein